MSSNPSFPGGRRLLALAGSPTCMTACVAGLAIALVGCSSYSNSNSRSQRFDGASRSSQLAEQSKFSVDPNMTAGQYDPEWYALRSSAANLPPMWLGEAVQSAAGTRAHRADAIAKSIAQQAKENTELSQAQLKLREAMSDEQISLANADGVRGALDASIAQLFTQASAREAAYKSEARLHDAELDTMVRERQSEFEMMRSQATLEFNQAQAEHERMLAQFDAVDSNGQVDIEKMIKVAQMTKARAASKVRALRVEGDSLNQLTQAQTADLDQQIKTLAERNSVKATSLRSQASSLEDQSSATTSELLAQADAIEQRDTDQQYALQIKTTDLNLSKAKSSFDEANQQADAIIKETVAEVERRRAENEEFILGSKAEREQQIAATRRFLEQGQAEVFIKRANAVQIEDEARAEFVKAQVEAIAQSQREASAHLGDLADKQFEQITAQAQADAAAIRAQMTAQLAQQLKVGANKSSGKTIPSIPTMTHNAATPQKPQVAVEAPIVLPEHIATFKSALAAATRLRTLADAHELAINATFKERMDKLSAWWTQQESKHEQKIADIGVFTQQAMSNAQATRANAQRDLSLAKASHVRATAQAEAFRKDAFASITSLRAQATKNKEQNTAEATRLLAHAEAVEKGGAAEVRALTARRHAVAQRGKARARQLFAHADSIETGQQALVAQMMQEIESSKQILRAQLAQLNQAADSYMQIAQATYEEAFTLADTFAEKTKIASTNQTISNEVDRKIAQAGVDHLRDVIDAQELAGSAQVDRMVAQATAEREFAESTDVVTRAIVYAQSETVEALVTAQLAAADANDENTRSRFESRVATVQGQRDRAFAARYLSESQRQARLAQVQAAADAYQGMSTAAFARLNDKRRAFENAAQDNWDARLALPASMVTLDWPTLTPSFNMPGEGEPFTPAAIVGVDTDVDSDLDNN